MYTVFMVQDNLKDYNQPADYLHHKGVVADKDVTR
jgi:hypothetical protein